MDDSTRTRLEYEEQFYGMSSRFFIDSFKNFFQDELHSKIDLLVNNFENKIINQTENVEKLQLALNGMREILKKEFTKSLDDVVKESEAEICSIMNIPSNVLLKEDLPVRDAINGDIDEVNEEIENLKGVLQSKRYLKQVLLEELEDADSTIISMENFITDEKFNFDVLPVEEICKLSKENKSALDSA